MQQEHIEKIAKAIELRGYAVAEWYPGKKAGDQAVGMDYGDDTLVQPWVVLCETDEVDYIEQQQLVGDTVEQRTFGWIYYRFVTD